MEEEMELVDFELRHFGNRGKILQTAFFYVFIFPVGVKTDDDTLESLSASASK